ncbi:hypothetical protein, partial [Yersinia bercovieri]|uniref:hypothetical protein n=1 Tax=Yersinia bercovieri TaxID=634 RepID=UPI0025AB5973
SAHRDLFACCLAVTPMTLANIRRLTGLILRPCRYSGVSFALSPESLTQVSSSGFVRLLPCCNTNDFG